MHVLCQVTDLICYLDGQLTGRTKSNGLQLFLLRIDLLKKRDTKGCCLTGSGLGLTDGSGKPTQIPYRSRHAGYGHLTVTLQILLFPFIFLILFSICFRVLRRTCSSGGDPAVQVCKHLPPTDFCTQSHQKRRFRMIF